MEIKVIKEYLDILGIPYDVDFTKEDIKSCFRTRSKFYHPDLGKVHDSEKKFIKLKMAEEYLLSNFDAIKRHMLIYKSSFLANPSPSVYTSSTSVSKDEHFNKQQEDLIKKAEEEKKRKEQEERNREEQEKRSREEERLKREREKAKDQAQSERKRKIEEIKRNLANKLRKSKQTLFRSAYIACRFITNKKVLTWFFISIVFISSIYTIGKVLTRVPQIHYRDEDTLVIQPNSSVEDLEKLVFLGERGSCRLDDEFINFKIIGEYKVDLVCKDVIDKYIKTYNIVINDDVPPTLIFTHSVVEIQFDVIDSINYLSFIENIFDNYYHSSEIRVDFELIGDFSTLGTKEVEYCVTDASNNFSCYTLFIQIIDSTKPIIELNYPNPIIMEVGSELPLNLISVTDNYDVNISYETFGDFDCSRVGDYTLLLMATDISGNQSSIEITLIIQDTTAPIVYLVGNQHEIVEVGNEYIEAYIIFSDNYDLNPTVTFTSNLNKDIVGEYYSEYKVEDSEGNITIVTRRISVVDTTSPTIELVGDEIAIFRVGDSYVELGVIVSDNYDYDPVVVISTPDFDFTTFGEYQISYYAIDAFGNHSDTIFRTIIIEENEKPTHEISYIYSELSTIINLELIDEDTIIIAGTFFFEVNLNGSTYFISNESNSFRIEIHEMMSLIQSLEISLSFNYDMLDGTGEVNIFESVHLVGTSGSPLQVSSSDDFNTYGFAYFSIELLNDIYLTNNLGSFYGKFEGNNHSIIFLDETTKSVFQSNWGTIINTVFSVQVRYSGGQNVYVSGLFKDNYGLIENIVITGSIYGSANTSVVDAYVFTSGFGINNYGTIRNSSINANITSNVNAANVGGAYAYASSFLVYNYGIIHNCDSSGIVLAKISAGMPKMRWADADVIYNEGVMAENTTTASLRYE